MSKGEMKDLLILALVLLAMWVFVVIPYVESRQEVLNQHIERVDKCADPLTDYEVEVICKK